MNHSTGALVVGRCKATNLCRYCQRLYVIETVELLTLDAVEHAPQLWMVLTAREHLTRAQCREHLRQLRKKLRRRWPGIEWFVQVEFQRRGALHLNLLIKGVPVDELDELRAAAVELWCARVDALPVGQWAGVIEDGVGVVRYLSKMLAHGLKAEQAPPIGWRGHRTSQTRGYLVRPAAVMREEARRSLRLKRLLWRGVELETAELELQAAELVEWSLRHVNPSSAPRRMASPVRRESTSPASAADSASYLPADVATAAGEPCAIAQAAGGGEGPATLRPSLLPTPQPHPVVAALRDGPGGVTGGEPAEPVDSGRDGPRS